MAFLVKYGKWFLKQSWPYAETVANDDARLIAGLGAAKNDPELLATLAQFIGHPLNDNPDIDEIFDAVIIAIEEHPDRRAKRLASEATGSPRKDERVFLFERLYGDQKTLKQMLATPIASRQVILDKEPQLEPRLGRAAESEAALSDAVIRRLLHRQEGIANLLAAFNRDDEIALHQSLIDDTTIAGRYVKSSVEFCAEARDRMLQGVRVMPWNNGKLLPFWEYVLLFSSLVGILIINCTTEYFTFTAKEYVGVGRNGVSRPRSLYQPFIMLFVFACTDGWAMWEIGRQRSLGALLSWCAYFYAHIHPEVYDKLKFVLSVAVLSVAFQTFVQLSDIILIRWKLYTIGKEARPGLSWFRYVLLSFQSRMPNWRWLPNWLNWHHELPIPRNRVANRVQYDALKRHNAVSAAWAKGFNKSKPMSITWMIYARNLAMPRNIYAARAAIIVKLVFTADYVKKQILMVLTLLVWGFSDYATWGKWQTFTIITAFFAATSAKLQDLAFAPEQEVQASFNVFCNMVGGNIPTLCGVLAPNAAHPEWFETPDILEWLMPVIFTICLWTDLFSQWLLDIPSLPGKLLRWAKAKF